MQRITNYSHLAWTLTHQIQQQPPLSTAFSHTPDDWKSHSTRYAKAGFLPITTVNSILSLLHPYALPLLGAPSPSAADLHSLSKSLIASNLCLPSSIHIAFLPSSQSSLLLPMIRCSHLHLSTAISNTLGIAPFAAFPPVTHIHHSTAPTHLVLPVANFANQIVPHPELLVSVAAPITLSPTLSDNQNTDEIPGAILLLNKSFNSPNSNNHLFAIVELQAFARSHFLAQQSSSLVHVHSGITLFHATGLQFVAVRTGISISITPTADHANSTPLPRSSTQGAGYPAAIFLPQDLGYSSQDTTNRQPPQLSGNL